MKLVEADAKALLADGGLRTPRGTRAQSLTEASAAIDELGAAVVKAQVPAGGRGKAGGVVVTSDADEASAAAERLLGSTLGDHVVDGLLIEERVDIARDR